MKIITIIFLLMNLMLTGCVGTVEDTAEGFTKASDAGETPLRFAGIQNAIAISDSRIEVFFYPAAGGTGKYTYDVHVGNSSPISIPGDVLIPDYRGLLKTTITGLDRLTPYQIKVEVRDGDSQVQSDSKINKTATTFDNIVADFGGISSASNTAGQAGKDSIRIRWTPAKSSPANPKPAWQPVSYEVVIVDSDKLTPKDMDAPYTEAQGRWVRSFTHQDYLNEYTLTGLPAKTKFYVRMRAIHFASDPNDVFNPQKRSEQNTNYVTISTLSGSLTDINFQPGSFAVALSAGEKGLTSVQASWTAASGVFDHYRLYYSLAGAGGVASGVLPSLCLTPESTTSGTIYCKKADFSANYAPITGLLPYRDYEVRLVLCATSACGQTERIEAAVQPITTDPNSATFSGVKDILSATNVNEIGELKITYDVPDFGNGYFDGLILEMRRTQDGTDSPVTITATGAVFHTDYNFLVSDRVTVKGIDYLSVQPYCFTLYPYKLDSLGAVRPEPNNIWKCVQPVLMAPTAVQFPGLTQADTTADKVTLTWAEPTIGIFTKYELFWSKTSGTGLNWGHAIAQAANNFNYANYGRILIDSDKTTYTMQGFPDGTYTFGMTTYHHYVSDTTSTVLRSETNENVKTCTFTTPVPPASPVITPCI